MSKQFAFNPKLDFAIERFIDAPTRLVWEALTNRSIAKSSFGLKVDCVLMSLIPSP